MWVLVALSIYAIAVVIFKVWQFMNANVFDRSFIESALFEIKQGDRDKARRKLSGIRGPVARIMRVAFECVANRDMTQKSREAEIMRVGSGDIRYLESHLRGLELCASVAPLAGLLGTVIGLIRSFARLGEAGTRVDPSMLAGGIWEALLTTAVGLTVAIPTVAVATWLERRVDRLAHDMEDAATRVFTIGLSRDPAQKVAQEQESHGDIDGTRARAAHSD
jgi:biopolymer transport protein ExbB